MAKGQSKSTPRRAPASAQTLPPPAWLSLTKIAEKYGAIWQDVKELARLGWLQSRRAPGGLIEVLDSEHTQSVLSKDTNGRPPTHKDDPLLSCPQAGRQLSVDSRTVKRMVHRGYVKGIQIGGMLKIRQSEVDRLLTNFAKTEDGEG